MNKRLKKQLMTAGGIIVGLAILMAILAQVA
jgi:hypothetical protein